MIGMPRLLSPLLALCIATTSHANSLAPAEAELIGHYYLNGMMEVGSELLLQDDGLFRWSIAYGSVDNEAVGEWSLDSGVVTLAARKVPTPVDFTMANVLPWDETADEMRATRLKEQAKEAFRLRCPIEVLQQEVSPAISDAAFAAPPTVEELIRAKEFADFARDRAQAILDRVTARPRWQQEPTLVAEIDSALAVSAQANMRRQHKSDSARAAGMAVPLPPAPLSFPTECKADDPRAAPAPGPGTLVAVFDPERGRVARGFTVEAAYDRGPAVREVLGPRGVAYFPLSPGRRIVTLTLTPPGGTLTDENGRLPVKISEPAIQLIHAELPPNDLPFEQLQLAVEDGGRLRPLIGLRGHYVRSDAR